MEPKSINFNWGYFEIDQVLEACVEMVSTENTLEWSKESGLTMVK